jgi:squalene cyclase
VRSTAEALSALRDAGAGGRAVERARDSLLSSRAGPHGDYEILGPPGPAAAWSIKPESRRFPSLLDTVRTVTALHGLEGCSELLDDAQRWVASMQRKDGGFALFDRDAATAPWLRRLPFGLLVHTLNDVSSPEVTGRVLELAASRGGLSMRDVDRACAFLERAQQADGAFRGPFSAGLLAGTSAALSGLAASGRSGSRVSARAVGFLLERQRPEGGWGESPETSAGDEYIDLGRSVPSHTATALSGLLAARTPAAMQGAHRAAEFLLWAQEPDGSWAEDDPSSAGLADVVYLRNPVDRVAKPLSALVAYSHVL